MSNGVHVDVAQLGLVSERLGGLPVVNAFYERLGIAGLLDAFVPGDDARLRLPTLTSTVLISAHSLPAASRPRRRNRSSPWLVLTAKIGSTVWER